MSGRTWRFALVALVTIVLQPAARMRVVQAQGAVRASAAMNAAVARAREVANGGDLAAARVLLDSMVSSAEPSSNDLAEALYWRAVLSERSGDAERDWKRLVIESPMSPQAPDALLKLGDIEILRGRPPAARAYLERLVRDFEETPQRGKASILIARSYFEERDTAHACATIDDLRTRGAPDGELLLQLNEMQRRCATAAANAAAATSATVAATAAPVTTSTVATTDAESTSSKPAIDKATKSEKASRQQYAVQIAAYDTRAQADALVKRLKQRGWKARIDGEHKPYRVRVGVFDTRADAAEMLAKLKKQGQKGFVAELGK